MSRSLGCFESFFRAFIYNCDCCTYHTFQSFRYRKSPVSNRVRRQPDVNASWQTCATIFRSANRHSLSISHQPPYTCHKSSVALWGYVRKPGHLVEIRRLSNRRVFRNVILILMALKTKCAANTLVTRVLLAAVSGSSTESETNADHRLTLLCFDKMPCTKR